MHHVFYPSWARLGPVLRRSWARLGLKTSKQTWKNVGLHENQHACKNDGSRHILGPTWPDLGSQKGAKRSPRRVPNAPKTSPKSSPKSKRKTDRKMDRPGLHDRLWRWTCAAPRPAGGDAIQGPKTHTRDLARHWAVRPANLHPNGMTP